MQGAANAADMGGPLGMTPVPTPAASPGGDVPATGTLPTAMRPLNRQDVAMESDSVPSKAMSLEELTHGFYNLLRAQERDVKWSHSIAWPCRERFDSIR